MSIAFDFSAFDRATDPIFRLLTTEQARAIAEYRGDRRLGQRLEQLAKRSKEGVLTDEERAEFDAYASANRFISLVQAKARRRLNECSQAAPDVDSVDPDEVPARERLKNKTPPNSVLLGLTKRAMAPPEIEDIQEERPW